MQRVIHDRPCTERWKKQACVKVELSTNSCYKEKRKGTTDAYASWESIYIHQDYATSFRHISTPIASLIPSATALDCSSVKRPKGRLGYPP